MSLHIDVDSSAPDARWLPSNSDLQQWLTAVFEHVKRDGEGIEVSFKWLEEKESQQLNHEYRGQDKPTNVLSFPAEMPMFEGEPEMLGDIAICSQVVEREARDQDKPLRSHWAHMVVHGVLHLLGYDHIEDAEALEMEALERDILASLGIEDPYR